MKLSRRLLLRSTLGALGGAWLLPRLTGCATENPGDGGLASSCLPDANLACSTSADKRIIESDGIPDHATGQFPNPGCPIPIRPQRHHYEMALVPATAAAFTPIGWSEVGVAITGVPFDPAGPYWEGDASSGWRFEVMSTVARPYLGLDFQSSHVQPSGAYHYHGLPTALRDLADAGRAAGSMTLVGFAADGFPMYAAYAHSTADDPEAPLALVRSSYRLKTGARGSGPGGQHDGTFVEDYEFVAGLGELDEANGRWGVTPEFPAGTYYYVVTDAFPFIPRMFRGTPDRSFVHGGDPGIMAVPPALRGYRG